MNKKVFIGMKSPSGRGFFKSRAARSLCFVIFALLLFNFNSAGLYGQVVKGVGISEDVQITPDASSILELRSVERGFLAPRMTTDQRNNISNPADGLLVYDTQTQSFWYWDQADSEWKAISALAWGTGNQLLGMNATGNGVEYKTLIGTNNQVIVDHSTGQIRLSTPQNIDINATPQFQNIFVDNLSINSGVYTDNTGWLTSTPPSSGIIGYWDRNGALKILYPSNVGDSITTSGSIYTTGDGSIYTTGNGYIHSETTISSEGNMTSGGLFTSEGGADINGATTIDGTTTITGATTINGDLTLVDFTTAGILHNDASGLVSSSLIVNDDIADGTINLTSKVTNILPIANGGTNSGTTLYGSSIMVSDGTSIIQGEKGTTTTVLHGNASGAPTYGLVVNDDLDKMNIPISGFGAATANVPMGNQNITNLLDPVNSQDAATKNYVDLADAAIQAELDVTQTGAGLSATGAYAANSGTNYIDAATSLNNADVLLDAAIASNASDVSDLQAELDATQTGAGLDADGDYNADAAANYINTAGSLFQADQLLDTQAKTNADNLATETANRTSADAAIQAELDVTQTGAGLSATGAYAANSGTNYIDAATSLNNADVLLDAAIATNASDVSDLQDEVDRIETGAGLGTDGTYVANSGTNYIDPATSLAGADLLLDAAIASNASDVSDLQDEVNRIETGAGLDADGDYNADATANYINTAGSLFQADQLLDAQAKTNADNLATETANRTSADAAIQAELDATQTGAGLSATGAYVTNTGTNYIDAAANLAGADLLLDAAIASNASDVSDLQDEVDRIETGAGLDADGDYNADATANYINTAGSLFQADQLLDTQAKTNADNLATETANRTSADATIQAELDATQTGAGLGTDGTYVANSGTNYIDPATSLAGADLLLDAAIASNASDVSDLQDEVNRIETGAGLGTDGTYVANSGTNYIDPATSLAGADLLLDAAIASNASDVSDLQDEVNRIETGAGLDADGDYNADATANYINTAGSLFQADQLLDAQAKTNADNLATETANRTSADAVIQAELDVTQTGAGLGTDGTYVANSGTNYIDPATSLAGADLLLDAAIASNASDVSDLQDEVNRIETGAGLDADGDYNADATANYINTAGSLFQADQLLDAQAKTNADNLATETANRTSADAAIQAELDVTQTGAGLSATGAYVANSGTNYIDPATSLANADILLDTQAKTNADNLATETANRTSADAAIQAELDATQTGAGLSATGAYVTNTGTNYIDAAANLAGADLLLDAAIASNASDVSDLQDEVDRIETGAGLDANGNYVANAGTNYIGAATSLNNADVILDARAKTNADNLATETANRTSADAVIQAELDATQTGAGLSATGAYVTNTGTNYIDAAANLAGADLLLDAAIASNASDVSDLQDEVDRIETGAGLDANGNYVANAGTNYIGAATSLNNADVLLDTQAKTNADNLATETTNRTNADAAIQAELDATQTGAGLDADGDYNADAAANYINTAGSLFQADQLLDTQAKTNADNLATETTNRTNADAAIQAELDVTQTGAGLSATGAYVANSGTNYIDPATSLANADILLDTQAKTNADNLATETANRTSADAAIQAELDATQTGAGLSATGAYVTNTGTNYIDAAANLAGADLLLDAAIASNASDVSDLQDEVDRIETGAGLDANGNYVANAGTNYIGAATSLNNADVLLDTQAKTNADNLATETTNRTNADAAIQAELDATQTGAGLDADGDYNADAAANYINTAGSLFQADQLLDTQAKTNADNLATETANRTSADAAIQAELDVTQTGAGLSATGAYVANSGTNYIDPATSLANADILLDTQAKTNADNLATETANRTSADAAIQAELDATQTGAGLSATGAYVTNTGTNYIDAAANLAGADLLLDAAIASNASDVSDLQDEVDRIETGAGLDADGDYNADATANYINTAGSLFQADQLLDTQAKTNADNLATETANRTSADATIQAELDATQTGAGLGTDGTYVANSGTNYIDPATSLAGADLLLDAAIASNASDVSDLQDEVNRIETGAGLGTDGTYVANSGTNYIDPATSLAGADLLLDAAIASNASDVSDLQDEVNRIETGAGLDADGDYNADATANYINTAGSLFQADQLLDAQAKTNADNLATETANRTSADAVIQAELDVTQTGAGLGTDGTYVANSGTNYIDPATSLAGADLLLDAAIASNASDVSDLQDEVNRIETGAGLDADGDYNADATANYINTAGSLFQADQLLDAQAKTNADNLATETANRTSADAAIQAELDVTQTGAGLSATGAYVANSGTNYIDPATSLANADILLDTQAKTNADNLATETANRTSADAAIQAELDATQTGAGLSATGAYVTNTGTNYIDAAANLAGADLLLDAAIASNASDVSDLQDEVDRIETGAGLDANGNYVANAGTNYIGAATSLNNADVILDARAKTNADNLATETANRTSADAVIQAELDATQTGAGLSATGAYVTNTGTNYIDAAANLAGADLLLDAAIASNASDVSDLQDEVDRIETGAGLDANGNYVANAGTNYIGAATSLNNADVILDARAKTNADNLATETTNRTNADAAIQAELDVTQTGAGLSATGAYVANSGTNYIDPATSLANADILLDTQAKTNADNLATETANRTSADAAIQAELDATQTGAGLSATGAYVTNTGTNYIDAAANLAGADLLLDAAIASNASDVSDLQDEVDRIETGAGLDANGNYVANAGTNYIGAATSLNNADVLLDTQAKTNADNLATETTNRTNADAAIQAELDATQTGAGLDADGDYNADAAANYINTAGSLFQADQLLDTQAKTNADNLATETANRTSADAAIQAELDVTQTGAGLSATGAYVANSGTNYIDPATSLANADILLDTQAKTNADNLATETANRTSADAAIQAELDATQTGAGLSATGAYVTNTGTNYIDAAANLAGADLLLDAAIASNATNVSNLQTLTGIATGNTDLGTFTGTIIPNNSTIKSALQALETDLDTQTDDQTAAEVPFTSTGNLSSTNVQNALEELDLEKLALAGGTMSGPIDMGTNNITNGGSISGTTLTDGTLTITGGAISGATSIAATSLTTSGNIAATGTVSGSNLSGTNTGDVTLGTANGLGLMGQQLSLALVTTTTPGAMSATDKTKLDGIESGAEVNVNADWNASSGDAEILNKPTTLAGYGITDAMSTSHAANGISSTNITDWNTAYGWGNHSTVGYLTNYNETDPVVKAINGLVKSDGTTISAATAGTDYLTPSGDGSALTGLTGGQITGNISGNAANVTGTVAIANGGTGQTTQQAAINALVNNVVTAGSFLRGDGTNVSMSTIQASDIPILNQNTTGTAANVTGVVAVANGGTGMTTFGGANSILYTTAANNLSSITTANNGILVTDGTGAPSIGNSVGAALTMPSVNLSATSNQVVMQSGGVTGTLSWTPTTTNKTITFPDASGEVALKSAGASWLVDGNSGTNASINFIGTTDNQDVVLRANNTERLRVESTSGDIKIGDANSGTVKATKELVMRQDGDDNGSSILTLRNRSDQNGAILETTNPSHALVDFIFKTSDGASGTVQRNIRLEERVAARTGAPSFHIGGGSGATANPDNPTLSVGDNYSAFGRPLYISNISNTAGTHYANPTALLQLGAGTAAAGTAPLKLTAGTLLSIAEAGAIEYDGTVFYSTPTNSSRGISPSEFFVALTADYTGSNSILDQKVFNVPNNGAITLAASTTYMFEGQYFITCLGINETSLLTSFGGSAATFANISYSAIATKSGTPNAQDAKISYISTSLPSSVTPFNQTNGYITVIIKGIVRTGSNGGTFIPQFRFSALPGIAPVIKRNSYFKIYPIGSNTVTSVGNWN